MRCGFNMNIYYFGYLLNKVINNKKHNIGWREFNSEMLREILKKHLKKIGS